MNFDEAYDTSNIQLEPRMQEYMRKKKFNEENDIKPDIPEDIEFGITPSDMKLIKCYQRGNKNIYNNKKLTKCSEFVKPDTTDFTMGGSSIDFKQDFRYKRLEKKMQSHRDAQAKIRNLEGIDEDYKIFHQTNPYDSRPDKRPSRINKPYMDPNNDCFMDHYDGNGNMFMMDSRDLVLGTSRPMKMRSTSKYDERSRYLYNPNKKYENPATYNHPPKISYNQYPTPYKVNGGLEHSRDVGDIIGNIDSYNKHLNNTYEYIYSDADLDTHTFMPGSSSCSQREMANSYQSVPFMYGNGLPDVTVEESLRGGFRDSSKKSIGFQNPFEHNFSYISSDISDPDHSVQMWPQTTRGRNKEVARPTSRAVSSEKGFRKNILKNNKR